jgi:preprotein translocase subunit SecE
VARDRQRAKQRKARRAAQNPGPSPTEPHRANVPGELDHASGEADEFDAALVSGARGRPADADADGEPRTGDLAEDEPIVSDEPVGEEELVSDDAGAEIYPDELADEDEAAAFDEDADLEDEPDAGAAPAARRGRRAGAPAGRRAEPAASGPARFLAFLRASWAELQRVQWPDRRQVFQATAVVLGFVVIAGVYLGVADRIAQEVVDLII